MTAPTVAVTDTRTGALLASRVRVARTPLARLRGLLGRPPLEAGEGLLIEPCNGVHMFLMRYAIDVAFLDRQWRVVEVRRGLRPWRVVPWVRRTHAVLELGAGTLDRAGVQAGDVLVSEPAGAAA